MPKPDAFEAQAEAIVPSARALLAATDIDSAIALRRSLVLGLSSALATAAAAGDAEGRKDEREAIALQLDNRASYASVREGSAVAKALRSFAHTLRGRSTPRATQHPSNQPLPRRT